MNPDKAQTPQDEPPAEEKPVRKDVGQPLLPNKSPDDSDEGWGERRSTEAFSDEWYEEQRPPHW